MPWVETKDGSCCCGGCPCCTAGSPPASAGGFIRVDFTGAFFPAPDPACEECNAQIPTLHVVPWVGPECVYRRTFTLCTAASGSTVTVLLEASLVRPAGCPSLAWRIHLRITRSPGVGVESWSVDVPISQTACKDDVAGDLVFISGLGAVNCSHDVALLIPFVLTP
jgi:hypothetical protein